MTRWHWGHAARIEKMLKQLQIVPHRTSAMIGDASHNHPKVWILYKFKNNYIDINIDLNINE